jgi:hypothetical protein
MNAGMPTVNNRRCLEDALRLLHEKSAPAVGVVERLVGLVTSETVGEMLMLHQAMPARCSVRAMEQAMEQAGSRPAGA